MTGTYTDVSALEEQIIAESLRRVACIRPDLALVMAEILEAETEHEFGRLAHALSPEEATFALNLVGAVIAETGGYA